MCVWVRTVATAVWPLFIDELQGFWLGWPPTTGVIVGASVYGLCGIGAKPAAVDLQSQLDALKELWSVTKST